MSISLLLCLTSLLFLHTAATLHPFFLYILVAQFLVTVFVTFFVTFFTCIQTRLVHVDFQQLSCNPWPTCSHLNTGPLKKLRSCNVLWLRPLWCSRRGYSPSLLPLSSYFPGVLPHWQKPSLCIIKMYFSYWNPPGVSGRMWSVNLDASISGEYQTKGGHSCWPLK